MNVAVIGLGKLGLPLAATIAGAGHQVIGADIEAQRVADSSNDNCEWCEPGLAALLRSVRSRFRATVDARAAAAGSGTSLIVVCTPTASDGSYDHHDVLAAVEAVGLALRDHARPHVVIVCSTVMPGAMGGEIAVRLQRAARRPFGPDLGLCYCPIFAALGVLLREYREPDFVLIGESDANAGDTAAALFASIMANNAPIARMPLIDAELAKIAINNFVMAKMSFANMMADVCAHFPGADVERVTTAMGLDRRIGKSYLRGTMPYGGPCFGRDAGAFVALARHHNTTVPLIEATATINKRHTDQIIAMMQEAAPVGSTVAVLGLAFRPNSNVVEASPSIAIANALQASNRRVRAWDPLAADHARRVLSQEIDIASGPTECLANADVVLVANADPAFAAIAPETWAMIGKRAIVFDCWRILPADRMPASAELRYIGAATLGSRP